MHKKMVPRQQVLDYISSSLRSGYDLPSIRSRLIASGYEVGEINAAIDLIRSGKTSVGGHSRTGTYAILAIAIIGFLLIGGVATVFFNQSSQTPIIPTGDGSSAFAHSTATNSGNSGTSGDSTSADNTIGSTGTSSNGVKTNTGSSASSASSSGSTALSGVSPGRNIPQIDYSSTATDSSLETRFAIENKVNSLAVSQPDAAAQLCGKINTIAGQQSCLNTVAQQSEQSKFCTQISDNDSADICLTSLALKQVEDVNLCNQMNSDIRRRSCVLLYDSQSQLDTLQKSAANVQTPALSAPPSQSDLEAGYSVNLDDVATTTVDNSTSTNNGISSSNTGANSQDSNNSTADISGNITQ